MKTPRILTQEEANRRDLITNIYNKLLGDYVSITSVTEALINYSIAKLIGLNGVQSDLFVKVVLKEVYFNKKYKIFKNLLKEKNPELLIEYKKEIDRFGNLIDKRNTFAHSYLAIDDEELARKDISKIAFRNVSNNLNEKIYLDVDETNSEAIELFELNHIFRKIDDSITSSM